MACLLFYSTLLFFVFPALRPAKEAAVAEVTSPSFDPTHSRSHISPASSRSAGTDTTKQTPAPDVNPSATTTNKLQQTSPADVCYSDIEVFPKVCLSSRETLVQTRITFHLKMLKSVYYINSWFILRSRFFSFFGNVMLVYYLTITLTIIVIQPMCFCL